MTQQTRHILVVDDMPQFLAFMELLLVAEGFTVSLASSLAAAEAALVAVRPDVVVCDVRMPGLPPFAMLNLIRGGVTTCDLPVLLCTGAVQDVQRAGGRLAGARTTVLLKPFDIDDLLAGIERLSAGVAAQDGMA